MTGAHRPAPVVKGTAQRILTWVFAFVILATFVGIVATQVNWGSNKSKAAPAPVHISASTYPTSTDSSFTVPNLVGSNPPISATPTVAATQPSSTAAIPKASSTAPTSTPTVTTAPSVSPPVATTAPAPAAPTAPQEQVYVVRVGDTLTSIASFFQVNGYAPLYTWNKAVIGANPNLILPGQTLLVVPGTPPPLVVNP